jgi:hypothetical protein
MTHKPVCGGCVYIKAELGPLSTDALFFRLKFDAAQLRDYVKSAAMTGLQAVKQTVHGVGTRTGHGSGCSVFRVFVAGRDEDEK